MSLHSSKACCDLPPVQAKDYNPSGHYKDFAGTKCYVTGPSDAKKAVFFIYDIFGYRAQTLQGADILAKTGNYLVVMPDFFHGQAAEISWFFGTSEESQAKKNKFLSGLSFKTDVALDLHGHVKAALPHVESWGCIGYCWGGKLAVLTSQKDTPWTAAVQTSPAMVDPEDAQKLTIPFATLASKDEDEETVSAFAKAQETPKLVERFEDQVHGWMSARFVTHHFAFRCNLTNRVQGGP